MTPRGAPLREPRSEPRGDAAIVGFAGRLVAQKDPGAFVEAAAHVAPRAADARFVVLGDGPERAALEALVAARSASRTGSRSSATAPTRPRSTRDSTSSCSPRATRACRSPCSRRWGSASRSSPSRIPGIDEAVADGVTGRLVEGGQPRALGTAISELLGLHELRESMGRAARARALERFSPADMVRKTVDLYRRVLAD